MDVLQVCVTFYNMYEYYTKKVYELKDHNREDYQAALEKIREWDYNNDAPIGLGVFYQKNAPTFESKAINRQTQALDRDLKIKNILEASQ